MNAQRVRWLERLPYDTLLAYRQAFVLQYLALLLVGGTVAGALLAPFANQTPESLIIALANYAVVLIGVLGSIWLLRRGHLRPAVMTLVLVILMVLGVVMALYGKSRVEYTLPGLIVPIILSGMILGRQKLWLTSALAIAIVAVTWLGIVYAPQWFGTVYSPESHPLVSIAGFALVIVIISLVIDRFGGLLRQSLEQAQAREAELETLRASLERTVEERTVVLQQKVDELLLVHDTVRMLSVPALPVLPGVLVLPLIGSFDSRRIDELNHTTLHAVEQRRARSVIFDVTGIPAMDTHTAQALLQTAAAVRLLGAQPWLVGLRTEVAQTIVSLGVDLRAFRTSASLESAISLLAGHSDMGESTSHPRAPEPPDGNGAWHSN